MKKLLPLLLVLCLLAGCSSSGSSSSSSSSGPARLSFAGATDFSAIQALDGQTVTITGYMATLSPLNGEYIYLMNLPYQSCPFCVPNTTQLSNTMAVYAKKGTSFEYTDQAIRVTGKMEVSDTTDDFGYVYNYRIVDATSQVIDLGELTGEYRLWYSIAEDGLVADINTMFDYLYFLCQWTEYTSYFEDDEGVRTDYYLFPGDVEMYLQDTGPYGYAAFREESYFPSLVARIRSISATELEDLVGIVEMAQAAEQYALSELENEQYTYDEQQDKYILAHDQELYKRFEEPWLLFSQWLARWEM